MEGAALAEDLPGLAPVDVEDPEPVQQVAPGTVRLVSEVEVDRLLAGLRLHAQPAGQLLKVGGEGRDRGIGRRLAHDLADDQAVAHEPERQIRTHREAGADGLVQLGQRRHGAAAHRGEGLGQADGLDQVRGGGVHALLSEERATRAIHDTASGSAPDQRWAYQPGDSMPAP